MHYIGYPTILGRVRLGIFRNKNVFRNIFRLFCSWEQNSQNEIQVFRNENSSQTNAYLHYSNYSYSGLIPNERALRSLSLKLGSVGEHGRWPSRASCAEQCGLSYAKSHILLPLTQTVTDNRVPKCDVTKNEFVKLWDLVPFSNKASLGKGPCQKWPLKCNSQPKYKGWKFDTAPYKSL